jgi:radical SAM protein with 4Fe4S-binding SPASM domain
VSYFHDIKNKNLLEECPPNININHWKEFRDKYKQANNFNIFNYPIQIDIELNGGCNMKCPFCIHGYVNKKIPNILLSFDAFKKIIDEAVSLGTRGLKLNYINEPMLRKDLEQFIKYAKTAGILNIYFVTNGTLLIPKRWDSIFSSGLTKIFVSVDATTEEIYNKQRLSGQFDKIKNNIISFIEERNRRNLQWPLVRVSFLKNQINLHQEKDFFDFWKDKADFIAFQKMNDLPDINTGLTLPNLKEKDKRCSFPFKQLVIDHQGDILPCCKLGGKKLALGNIKTMTLKQAWNSESMLKLQKLHKNNQWQQNSVCKRCIDGS